MEKTRSSFTGKLGFILAAAGSAVGLGNLWRFPYLAAEYGGGIFLLTYLVLALTFGFTLMVTEIAIGRKTGLSAIGAFKALDKKFGFVGYLAALVPIIILPYYSVIGGWVAKYLVTYISGGGHTAAGGDFFVNFIGSTSQPLAWFALFLGVTALIVLFGVEKGIEKVSKVMMPILAVLSVGIAIFVVCQPGAWAGVKYYLMPNFAHFSIKTVIAAMGQLFYSMSLAMGIMITYGSYMKKDVHIEKSVHSIEWFDTGIAFIAGLMMVPVAFMDAGSAEGMKSGPGLMFMTLPKVFEKMPLTNFIGAAFFLLVLFAALTSSISLMETIVSILQDKLHWNRKVTCLVVFLFSFGLGVPSSLGNGIWGGIKILGMAFLDFFDFISNNVMMPIVALFTCFVVGYILKPKTVIDEVEFNGKFKAKGLYSVMVKYIAPICLLIILVSSVLDALGKALGSVFPFLQNFII